MCLQEEDHRGKVVISSYQGYKLPARLVLPTVTLITCLRSWPPAVFPRCTVLSGSHHRQPTRRGWGTFYLPEGRAATEAIWNCSPLEIYLLCPHLLIPSLIYMRTDSMGIYCTLYYNKILLIYFVALAIGNSFWLVPVSLWHKWDILKDLLRNNPYKINCTYFVYTIGWTLPINTSLNHGHS